MSNISKQGFLQRALAGVLIDTAQPVSRFGFGTRLYDETQGFTYRVQRVKGSAGTKVWNLESPVSSVVSTINGTPLTAATMTGVIKANIGGGALALPLASTVPALARFTIVNINAAALTVTADVADTALAPPVVLTNIGATFTAYSDGVSTWTQTVNDPGAT